MINSIEDTMIEEEKEWFEEWFDSPYYNLLYQHRDEDEAKTFIDNLVSYINLTKGDKVIDMGCGEGRHAIELAHHGLEVTGIDIAPNRIKKAIANSPSDIAYFVHDMRESFRVNYFRAVFNFFTSFGYFSKRRETMEAAHSLVAALKKGGDLIIDYLNINKALESLVQEEIINKGVYSFHITRRLENGQIIKTIRVVKQNGDYHDYEERVAAFNKQDFLSIFEPLGVNLINTFGDYHLNPFNEVQSPRLILHFKKP